ncbi:MAG TPA: ATP-binding protein [Thermoanaerobaculia bacterium]|nr:ATP-binding protein [Thermoanaerobaculia bacterium]
MDPLRLRQVLYNYLSNALKFTPAEGRVTVRARVEGERHFRLEVEDTGIGIRPEDIGRLFADFEQLETGSTKKQAGTVRGVPSSPFSPAWPGKLLRFLEPQAEVKPENVGGVVADVRVEEHGARQVVLQALEDEAVDGVVLAAVEEAGRGSRVWVLDAPSRFRMDPSADDPARRLND